MNEIIRKRKSIRKYDQSKLDESILDKVREKIAELKPLYPGIRYSVEIVDKAKGAFGVTAPHYLIFGSEEKDGYLENIGFIGQQMDLFFAGSGIGACWLGMAKPEDKSQVTLPTVISMSFGNPAEPLYRDPADFKRKELAEVSEGDDPRLEAARLAPSARNAQNWFFACEDGKIICYRKKTNSILSAIMDKLHILDMGIALCHIAEESEDFSFGKEEGAPERKGYVYTGTVGI